MSSAYLGWDIGGAHLKLARLDAAGRIVGVRQLASPLWHGVEALAHACAEVDIGLAEPDLAHAITMTGELCDVFEHREEGVRRILDCVVPLLHPRAQVRVWGGAAGWLEVSAAMRAAAQVASANWLALANYVASGVGDALLVDIGSTTTDILRLRDGRVDCRGHDDLSRLACGELVYTGVVRTPVFAVCAQAPYRGAWQPLLPEWFASMGDVHRLLGDLAADDDLMPTADGRGKDANASAARLARALGTDLASDDLPELRALARHLADAQRQSIARAIDLVASRGPHAARPACLIGAGVGRFLAARIARELDFDYRDFATLDGADGAGAAAVSSAAPAVAVAKLLWMAR